MNYKKIGRNIKNAREHANMTQRELSSAVAVSKEYLSYIETGKRKLSMDLLGKIAECLSVRPADLIA